MSLIVKRVSVHTDFIKVVDRNKEKRIDLTIRLLESIFLTTIKYLTEKEILSYVLILDFYFLSTSRFLTQSN